jgi:endonuclease-3 related protein
MAALDKSILRQRLLSVRGIGSETADSILLYALGKPIFVIDRYTKRILSRHRLISEGASYEEAQNLFMRNLRPSVRVFNEYHALLVRLAKEFCLKNKPDCQHCPLRMINKRRAHA